MKFLNKLSVFPLFFFGLAAQAQTVTVVPAPKKLQQLYLSVGTGPAITDNDEVHTFGETIDIQLTGGFCAAYILRLGYKNTGFANQYISEKTTLFSFLDKGYYKDFVVTNEIESFQLAAGKRKTLNKFVHIQALAGVSLNKYFKPEDLTLLAIEQGHRLPHLQYDRFIKPGAFIQAEAMFLPTKFAGLTLGTYYHYVPEISNGGLTLSLNLGLLRRN